MKATKSSGAALGGLLVLAALTCRADPSGTLPTTVPLQQARIELGQNYPQPTADAQDSSDGLRVQLDAIEVEERALPGIPENPAQAEIPFGLAGVAWGFRHPSEAARLFLPVQN